jgi:hypothetical protein
LFCWACPVFTSKIAVTIPITAPTGNITTATTILPVNRPSHELNTPKNVAAMISTGTHPSSRGGSLTAGYASKSSARTIRRMFETTKSVAAIISAIAALVGL